MWNLKRNGTNELIYKLETNSQTWRRNLWLIRGKNGEEWIVWEFRMDMHTLLYLKWIINKDLLYSTVNSAQCYVEPGWEGAWESMDICIRVAESL